MIKDERPLVEKLRQLAKWYNLSNPYAHRTLLEAAERIESLEKGGLEFSQKVTAFLDKMKEY